MSYRIQVFHPAANAYLPTPRTSRTLGPLRRLIASSPLGPNRSRIVDPSGTPVPNPRSPRSPRSRDLTLRDIAQLMGVALPSAGCPLSSPPPSSPK